MTAIGVRTARPPLAVGLGPASLAAGAAAAYAATLLVAVRWVPGTYDYSLTDSVWFGAWLAYVAVGALILRQVPGHRVGRLLLGIGCVVQAAGLVSELAQLLLHEGAGAGLTAATAWVGSVLYLPPLAAMGTLLPLLYPDGTCPRDRRRHLLTLSVASAAVLLLGVALTPGRLDAAPVDNPIGLTSLPALPDALVGVGGVGVLLLTVACTATLVVRWRRAGSAERRALAHLALGAVVLIALVSVYGLLALLDISLPATVGAALAAVGISALPVATGLAVLRTQLFDIELVLRRTLTYVAVSMAVLALYAGGVVGLGSAIPADDGLTLSVLITAVTAVALSPLREFVQTKVDRLLYGRRGDPYGVLRDLDARLARTSSPGEVLPTVATAVAQALRLPYAAITLEGREGVAATFGAPQPVARVLALQHHGQPVGQLLLAARSPGEQFSSLDDQLLADVADHAGIAAAAVMLAEDAQQSRQRLVQSLEEDRRRVRRDLHDHLGPVLGGITLQLDALRRLTFDNEQAHALATTIRDEVTEAVKDVRRLVHGLRPPVLDQLGLVEALRQYGDVLSDAVAVTVTVPAELPTLTAAVEVAAYRIVTEALTNVVRHADAFTADVTVCCVSNRLLVDISDDGHGIDAEAAAGVGLTSMRERAAELGGMLTIGQTASGCHVHAELPL
ncbi:MAG: Two component signal transduction histidine kinase [Frankiales bacterium]|nr:Two component signal transduction histidine kinase [Frankiales bacterium]